MAPFSKSLRTTPICQRIYRKRMYCYIYYIKCFIVTFSRCNTDWLNVILLLVKTQTSNTLVIGFVILIISIAPSEICAIKYKNENFFVSQYLFREIRFHVINISLHFNRAQYRADCITVKLTFHDVIFISAGIGDSSFFVVLSENIVLFFIRLSFHVKLHKIYLSLLNF